MKNIAYIVNIKSITRILGGGELDKDNLFQFSLSFNKRCF